MPNRLIITILIAMFCFAGFAQAGGISVGTGSGWSEVQKIQIYDETAWANVIPKIYSNESWDSLIDYGVDVVGSDKLILVYATNGLHAMELSDGTDAWALARTNGCTPAVDQANGIIYFQSDGRLDKLTASTGAVLDYETISDPNETYVSNTIYVDDSYGEYIITYWHKQALYSSGIRVYDADLDLVWQKTGLPLSKKFVPCYADGKIFTGYGNQWLEPAPYNYTADQICVQADRNITAYDITDGSAEWETNVHDYDSLVSSDDINVRNLIYANGYLFAETTGNPWLIYILDSSDGDIIDVYNGPDDGYSTSTTCASFIISAGKIFTPEQVSGTVRVTDIGYGDWVNWTGAFCNRQTNQLYTPDEAINTFVSPIHSSVISGGYQGMTIEKGVLYRNKGEIYSANSVDSFSLDGLTSIRTYNFANIYDSTPLVVKDDSDEWLIIAHEYVNERSSCRKVSDGSLVWNSTANQPGLYFFGYSYYEK